MEINITLLKKMGYYVATAAEAFRAYVIPTRYVEGHYLSGDDIHSEASGINKIGRILDYEWMHRKFARADQQKKVRIYTHLYRRNAEIAGFSRNIYEPWMENR